MIGDANAFALQIIDHEFRQRLHVRCDERDPLAPSASNPAIRAPALVTTGAGAPLSMVC